MAVRVFAPCWGMPRRKVSRASSLLLFALLAGCAVGPDFQRPAEPPTEDFLPKTDPTRRKHSADQRLIYNVDIPSRWWEAFGSPALNQLIEDGIKNNNDLGAAEAAVRVAQANALAQQATLFPVLGGNFNSTRQRVPTAALQSNEATGASIYNLHTGQVTVTFVADVWGGQRRQIEASEALLEAQQFQREAVYLTLVSNIALASIQEASLRAQIAVTRRLIGIQYELLGVLRRQYERGQIAMPDVAAQEAAVAQVELLLPTLERQLDQQRNLLSFLTGRLPSESDDMTANLDLRAFKFARVIPVTLPANLVRQRPDIRVAEANLRAANAQIGVALANRLPQIGLTGNAGSSATAIAQLFSPGYGMWAIAGSATQTIFDAGVLENRQRAAEAAFDQQTAQYKSVVLVAFQNVADTLRALQADARAVRAAVRAENAAARNIDLIRKQFDRGQISIPNLVVAQQVYLQASLARVQAQAARLADTVALFQALGGGWWNRTDEPEAPEPTETEEQ